jgi:PleD family two-component response regulator
MVALSPKTRTPPSPAASPGKDAPVVLVVDDEKEVRLLLVKMLGSKYTVFVASDGQEALDVLRRFRGQPRSSSMLPCRTWMVSP